MSVRMVVLGFLTENPLHGYEIKQLIMQRMGDWADIKFGSIYFALNKMAEEGLLLREERPGEAHRPAKFVYTITPAGREEFSRLLKENWVKDFRLTFPFDLAYFFGDRLPEAERRESLEKKKIYLRKALAYLDEHRKHLEENSEIPGMAAQIVHHTKLHYQAELDWLLSLEN